MIAAILPVDLPPKHNATLSILKDITEMDDPHALIYGSSYSPDGAPITNEAWSAAEVRYIRRKGHRTAWIRRNGGNRIAVNIGIPKGIVI